MEFASNGFLVLALDHHDGSCAYTEDQNGKPYHFDAKGPHFQYEDMNRKVIIRTREVKELIDDMQDDKFLAKLGFNAKLKLDMQSLIVAGHSFGGATAIKAGFEDRRIKCILTLDPWLMPIREDCLNGTLGKNIKKPIFILNSSTFESVANEKAKEVFESFLTKHRVRENCKFENIIIEKGHHFHQNDSYLIHTMELELLCKKLPSWNHQALLLGQTWL